VIIPFSRTMNAASGTSAAAASGSASGMLGGASSLGKDDFIKLLVAQLKHQDPMNPQDGTQMATQLAQFSSVEQLMNINSTLSAQGNNSAGMATALAEATAINLIGKSVSVASPSVTVGNGDIPDYKADLATGGKATLNLIDANGNVVKSTGLGTLGAGVHDLDVAGLASGLPSGKYTIRLDVTSATGTTSTPATYVTRKVDGIQFGPNGIILKAGTATFGLSDITSVDASN
jgi:flagellar basal-body rod modification protein FlgD